MELSKRHGGPWDRGRADSFYRRGVDPHYYAGGTYTSLLITKKNMRRAEVVAYKVGYFYNQLRKALKGFGGYHEKEY